MRELGLLLDQSTREIDYLVTLSAADASLIISALRVYVPAGAQEEQAKGDILAVLVVALDRAGDAGS